MSGSHGAKFVTWTAALLVALFFACTSAQMVEKRGTSPYAPQNAREGGRVRYLVAGMESVVSSRREDAYRQMYDECRGVYVITREWDENGGTFTNGWGQSNTNSSATGSAYGTTYGNQYSGNAYVNGNSQTNVQVYSQTTTTQWHNIEFNCAPPTEPKAVPAPQTDELAARPVRRANVLAQLSLETGCPSSTIQIESEAGPSYRLVACGRTFVCIDAQPSPSCRAALVEGSTATQSPDDWASPPQTGR